jgi:hypothetical protein
MTSFVTGFINGLLGAGAQQITSTPSNPNSRDPRVGGIVQGSIPAKMPSGAKPIPAMCRHNDQDGVSIRDIAEHVFNGEIGSASRDIAESDAGRAVCDAVESVATGTLEAIANDVQRSSND